MSDDRLRDMRDDALLERLLTRLAHRPDLRTRWEQMLGGRVSQAMPQGWAAAQRAEGGDDEQ